MDSGAEYYKKLRERKTEPYDDNYLKVVIDLIEYYYQLNNPKGSLNNPANFSELADSINDFIKSKGGNSNELIKPRYICDIYNGRNKSKTKSIERIERIKEYIVNFLKQAGQLEPFLPKVQERFETQKNKKIEVEIFYDPEKCSVSQIEEIVRKIEFKIHKSSAEDLRKIETIDKKIAYADSDGLEEVKLALRHSKESILHRIKLWESWAKNPAEGILYDRSRVQLIALLRVMSIINDTKITEKVESEQSDDQILSMKQDERSDKKEGIKKEVVSLYKDSYSTSEIEQLIQELEFRIRNSTINELEGVRNAIEKVVREKENEVPPYYWMWKKVRIILDVLVIAAEKETAKERLQKLLLLKDKLIKEIQTWEVMTKYPESEKINQGTKCIITLDYYFREEGKKKRMEEEIKRRKSINATTRFEPLTKNIYTDFSWIRDLKWIAIKNNKLIIINRFNKIVFDFEKKIISELYLFKRNWAINYQSKFKIIKENAIAYGPLTEPDYFANYENRQFTLIWFSQWYAIPSKSLIEFRIGYSSQSVKYTIKRKISTLVQAKRIYLFFCYVAAYMCEVDINKVVSKSFLNSESLNGLFSYRITINHLQELKISEN